MGDSVNLAARLEGLNKEYQTRLLVSESTYAAASLPEAESGLVFRELDLIRVKGKLQPVTIYELMGTRQRLAQADSDWGARLDLFAQGRERYRERRWDDARAVFQALLDRWPDDGPARVFAARCQDYLSEGPEADWDGVYVMTHK